MNEVYIIIYFQQICINRKEKIKSIEWPKSNEATKWAHFDSNADAPLDIMLIGSKYGELNTMTTLICRMGSKRFSETGHRVSESRDGETGHRN